MPNDPTWNPMFNWTGGQPNQPISQSPLVQGFHERQQAGVYDQGPVVTAPGTPSPGRGMMGGAGQPPSAISGAAGSLGKMRDKMGRQKPGMPSPGKGGMPGAGQPPAGMQGKGGMPNAGMRQPQPQGAGKGGMPGGMPPMGGGYNQYGSNHQQGGNYGGPVNIGEMYRNQQNMVNSGMMFGGRNAGVQQGSYGPEQLSGIAGSGMGAPGDMSGPPPPGPGERGWMDHVTDPTWKDFAIPGYGPFKQLFG